MSGKKNKPRYMGKKDCAGSQVYRQFILDWNEDRVKDYQFYIKACRESDREELMRRMLEHDDTIAASYSVTHEHNVCYRYTTFDHVLVTEPKRKYIVGSGLMKWTYDEFPGRVFTFKKRDAPIGAAVSPDRKARRSRYLTAMTAAAMITMGGMTPRR